MNPYLPVGMDLLTSVHKNFPVHAPSEAKVKGGMEKMKMLKWSVILLAFLLAAIAMLPIASAEQGSYEPGTATEKNGPIHNTSTKLTGSEFSINDVAMSKEEFFLANAELIKFLVKTNNHSVVDQMMDTAMRSQWHNPKPFF